MKLFFHKAPYIFLLISVFLLGGSCNIINPAEPIPAYIQIDSVKVKAETGQGSASQKITDAWILLGDNDAGVYEIPKRFPVLTNGAKKIIISPGILENGSSTSRAIYPFYYPDTVTMNFQSKEIYHINPVFHYRAPTEFSINEDFEIGRTFVKMRGDTDMVVVTEPTKVFEGTGSGQIFMDATHGIYEGITTDAYTLPGDGSAIYIELNYRCNMTFEVGITVNNSSGNNTLYNWVINPKEKWNKIYLNLTEAVKLFGGGDYKILILSEKPSDVTEGYIYLDNFKLLHF